MGVGFFPIFKLLFHGFINKWIEPYNGNPRFYLEHYKSLEKGHFQAFVRDFLCQMQGNDHNTIIISYQHISGKTATSPHPIGSLMAIAWCSVKLVGAEGLL